MKRILRIILTLSAGSIGFAVESSPWDLEMLFRAPLWEESTVANVPGMKGLLYDAILVEGNRVQVFAYYSAPSGEAPEGGWPAVVCVHGGGGTAFSEWVKKWNDHGYAAISMDLEGHYPIRESEDRKSPRLPTENPGLHRLGIFQNWDDPLDQQWYYHAVAQVIQAHSLIRSFPDVNPDKVGLTGISWGGTLTSTIMGVDDRFAFAIPVYGCGFLPDSDGNQGLAIKPGRYTEVVNQHFDGSAYFGKVTIPVLWVNGTNDIHFPMPATQHSAQAVRGPSTLRFELEMRHGHGPGWAPKEIYAFADSVVMGGAPLARLSKLKRNANQVSVHFESATGVSETYLYYTSDTGLWPERKWESIPAGIHGQTLSSKTPAGTTACYFEVTDDRGLKTTSEFLLVDQNK